MKTQTFGLNAKWNSISLQRLTISCQAHYWRGDDLEFFAAKGPGHLTVIQVDHKCFCILFKYCRVRYEDSWLAEIGSCKRTIFTNLPANLQQRNKKRINIIVRSLSYNIWGNYWCDLGLYKQNPDELKQCYKEAWTQISMMWHTKNIKKLLKVVLQQWSQTRGPGASCGPRHPHLWPVHWREEI